MIFIEKVCSVKQREERFSTLSSALNTIFNFSKLSYGNLVTFINTMPEFHDHEILRPASDENRTQTSYSTIITRVSIESITNSVELPAISESFCPLNSSVNQGRYQDSNRVINIENIDTSLKSELISFWPHECSRTLALVSCTLGLFNLSRFAVLTVNYGLNFFIQFCILSTMFGIPFLWLQMSLGAKIKSGPVSMWKISPICIGIGISIIFVQYITTIYSSVAVVWILKYIKDIWDNESSYTWAESIYIKQLPYNYTNATQTISYYLNANILQRTQISKLSVEIEENFHINNELAIYLFLIWAAVFLILCKGLKFFGKFLLLFGILQIIFLAIIAVKLLYTVDFKKLWNSFSFAEFDGFLVNSKPWIAAAQEVFFTWGFSGASVIAISSRTHCNRSKSDLRKDAISVVFITLVGLCLSALVGLCSVQIIHNFGFTYVPLSYETSTFSAVYLTNSSAATDIISYSTKYIPHYSTLVGEVYRHDVDTKNLSGYQVLSFVTELLPVVVLATDGELSWIWTSTLFIVLFFFGFSQLCVMWKPISCAFGNSPGPVLLTCVSGLILSLPFITEAGIGFLYFTDLLLGGAWFIPALWCTEIFGVFLIRGRPYNGDHLVNDLKMSGLISAFVTLSWNILLPIGLIILAVIEYRISKPIQFYSRSGSSYFNYWSKNVGGLIQIGFLLLVPLAACIQICRYLTSGPSDILVRIQMLYKPLDELDDNQRTYQINRNIILAHNVSAQNSIIARIQNVDPPKYTPPPSYSTATGAKLVRLLRKSFRRRTTRHVTQSEQAETISKIIEPEQFDIHFMSSFYDRSLSVDDKYMLNKYRLTALTGYPLQFHSARTVNSRRRLSC